MFHNAGSGAGLLLVAALLAPWPGLAADGGMGPRRVTVTGNGKASAAPDQAVIQTGVTEEGEDLEAISEAARRKMGAVLKAVRSAGVEDKDIQTTAFQVMPRREDVGGRMTRAGYTVTNQARVTLHDLSRLAGLLGGVTRAGANLLNGPSFEISDPQKLSLAALDRAMQDAQAKARLLAEKGGAGLGEVLEIEDNESAERPRPLYSQGFMAASAVANAAGGQPVSAGILDMQASVTVTYKLR